MPRRQGALFCSSPQLVRSSCEGAEKTTDKAVASSATSPAIATASGSGDSCSSSSRLGERDAASSSLVTGPGSGASQGNYRAARPAWEVVLLSLAGAERMRYALGSAVILGTQATGVVEATAASE